MRVRQAISMPARFFRGLAYPFRAVGVLFGDVRVFARAVIPFLICAVVYVACFVAVVLLSDNLVGLIIEPGAWWRATLRVLLAVVVVLGSFLLLVFTYSFICLVVAAPLYEFLSGAVERKLTGDVVEEPFSIRNVIVDIGRALLWVGLILLIEVGVFIFGLLLVPVTTAAAFAVSGVLIGMECLEHPMERRRMRMQQKLDFARDHFWELMGFGLPVMVALGVPFVGVFFLPLGVVGGTMLFVEAEGEGQMSRDRDEAVTRGRTGSAET